MAMSRTSGDRDGLEHDESGVHRVCCYISSDPCGSPDDKERSVAARWHCPSGGTNASRPGVGGGLSSVWCSTAGFSDEDDPAASPRWPHVAWSPGWVLSLHSGVLSGLAVVWSGSSNSHPRSPPPTTPAGLHRQTLVEEARRFKEPRRGWEFRLWQNCMKFTQTGCDSNVPKNIT